MMSLSGRCVYYVEFALLLRFIWSFIVEGTYHPCCTDGICASGPWKALLRWLAILRSPLRLRSTAHRSKLEHFCDEGWQPPV